MKRGGSSTQINDLNGNTVVQSTDGATPSSTSEIEIDVMGLTVDALNIRSFEAIVAPITLE